MILGISALVIAIIALGLTLWRMFMKPKPEPVVVYQQPYWYDTRPLWFRHPAHRPRPHHRRHHHD